MKIKAKNPKAVAGCNLIVPFDGRISVDKDGCVEVSASCAEALVKGTSDWDYADGAAAAEEAAPQEEQAAEELSDRDKFAKELEGMTVKQMKDLCREGGFPEEEWKSLNKGTLTAYILDKYDTAAEEPEEEPEEPEEEEPEESPEE